MSNSRSLFPGATGPDGFISCFDHLISEAQLRRKLILKGGPGVGKSTFMRRIHTALCENGEPSTLYFCSGDPDSLDAVAIARKGLLILDGTAPHVVDPHIPGARDSIINLGDYLNESAMHARLPHIKSIMEDHSACTRRARTCLCAARTFIQDNSAIIAAAIDSSKLTRITHALLQSVLDVPTPVQEKKPTVRPVITDAVTPKGELCLIAENARGRVIRITGHPSMDFTPILQAVSRAAQAKRLSVEEYLNPRLPGGLLHIAIPGIDTLVTTSDLLSAEQTFDFAACIPQGALLRHECMLEQGRTSIQLNTQHAVNALKSAKELHDELESFYVPNMDFKKWQSTLERTISDISSISG